jgi:hypothetical protein
VGDNHRRPSSRHRAYPRSKGLRWHRRQERSVIAIVAIALILLAIFVAVDLMIGGR